MSMLAEPKRKQRWTLNPRGKLWTEDKNNFGHKMLEKMGWKHGKGLGAKENGVTNALKVAYKYDNKGMGYEDVEEWTSHEDNFSSFLENLHGNDETPPNDDIKVTSLQGKVENSRARINYHKFTKAKDLSRYSEKELANIFGRKSLKQAIDNDNLENADEIVESIDNNDLLVNKGSMLDYFKGKLLNLGKSNLEKHAKQESESENEHVGIGFAENIKKVAKKKKRKHVDAAINENSPIDEVNSGKDVKNEGIGIKSAENLNEATEGIDDNIRSSKKKKRKHVDGAINENSPIGEVNSEKDVKNEGIGIKSAENLNETTEGIDDNIRSSKKKKRKHVNGAINENSPIDEVNTEKYVQNECIAIESAENLNKTTEGIDDNTRSSKKKKRKHVDGAINENSPIGKVNSEKDVKNEGIGIKSAENLNETTEGIDDNIRSSKKKKRKHVNGAINENSPIDEVNTEKYVQNECIGIESAENLNKTTEEVDDNTRSTKKKKRKHVGAAINEISQIGEASLEKDVKNEVIGIESAENLNKPTEGINDNNRSTKKKKEIHVDAAPNKNFELSEEPRRKKKNKSVKEDLSTETIEEIQGETETIKKSKKSKKRDLEGVSNPAFTDKNDSQLENEISPEKKKKKKRKYQEALEEGIDNPTFHSKEDTSNAALDCLSPYEVKPKKKKKSKRNEIGVDNPALNLSEIIVDGDLMLNVVDTPVVLTEKSEPNLNIERVRRSKRKSVRFNDVLEEHIIPNNPSERSKEYISNCNELFDINTMVIEEGIKEEMEKNGVKYERKSADLGDLNDPKEINRKVVETSVKEELNRGLNPQAGFVNNGFDIRSVDKINFCNDKFELKTSTGQNGIDNKAFNKTKTEIEENVNAISNRIERYQAEVENNINECKYASNSYNNYNRGWWVGDVGTQISENIRVEEGLKLCFKQMHFRTPIPHYLKGQSVARAKKSYRHLIRGDITITFRNSNLHNITGYATQTNNTMG